MEYKHKIKYYDAMCDKVIDIFEKDKDCYKEDMLRVLRMVKHYVETTYRTREETKDI